MQYRLENRGSRRILIAEGAIGPGEGARLGQALDLHRPEEVWLHSPGGVAVEGPAMGRELRRRGVLVRVPNDGVCFSSCSLAFLGGAIRLVEGNGYYGVHVFSGDEGIVDVGNQMLTLSRRFLALPAAQRQTQQVQTAVVNELKRVIAPIQQRDAMLAALIARYLVEMSLSLDLLTDMFGTAFHERCWVTREGLTRYNIVNSE